MTTGPRFREPADTDSSVAQLRPRRYPYTTGLQAWSLALLRQLDAAHEQLDPVECEALRATLIAAVAHHAAPLREAA
jgi:hypothetical protein